jgi:hypothetical protein
MSYKTESAKVHDQRVADEAEDDRALMCMAVGCPRRWSVSGDRGRACSAHYWAERADWPRITEAVLRAETDRALVAAAKPVAPVSPEQRAQALAALAKFAVLVRTGQIRGALR